MGNKETIIPKSVVENQMRSTPLPDDLIKCINDTIQVAASQGREDANVILDEPLSGAQGTALKYQLQAAGYNPIFNYTNGSIDGIILDLQ